MKALYITKKIAKRLILVTRGKQIFKQEIILRQALVERGFDVEKMKIECDHILGKNYVNGIELSIKYPDSFYYKAKKLIPEQKTNLFYFNGNMSLSGKRNKMLEPFLHAPSAIIINSNDGRKQKNKGKFNIDYFAPFANTQFGLCPHQANWEGDKDYMWTYRFIEACFVEALPIIFEEAPLGRKFINGFHYTWKNELFKNENKLSIPTYNKKYAIHNRRLAYKSFCLSETECNQIRNSMKK